MELSGGASVKLAAHAIRTATDAQSIATQGISLKKGALGSGKEAGHKPAAEISISDTGRRNLQENGVQAAADDGLRVENSVSADRSRIADERAGSLETLESVIEHASEETGGAATDQTEGLPGLGEALINSSQPASRQSLDVFA